MLLTWEYCGHFEVGDVLCHKQYLQEYPCRDLDYKVEHIKKFYEHG